TGKSGIANTSIARCSWMRAHCALNAVASFLCPFQRLPEHVLAAGPHLSLSTDTLKDPRTLTDTLLIRMTWGVKNLPKPLERELSRRYLEALRSPDPYRMEQLCYLTEKIGGELNKERGLTAHGKPRGKVLPPVPLKKPIPPRSGAKPVSLQDAR